MNRLRLRVLSLALVVLATFNELATAENRSVEANPRASTEPSSSKAWNLSGDWEGTANWKGIIFTISFSVPEGSREVRNLKVVYKCTKGVGGMEATLTKPAKLLDDNTFNFAAGQGSSGRAKFVSKGDAEGTYKAPFDMQCGDKFLPISGKWIAQKKTT